MQNSELEIEKVVGGIRIRLPNRKLGKLRLVALFGIAMSIGMCTFIAFWMSIPLKMAFADDGVDVFALAFAGFGLLFLIPVIAFLFASVQLLRDGFYSTVHIDSDTILVKEHLGLFTRRRRCRREDVESLEIVKGLVTARGQGAQLPEALKELGYFLVANLKPGSSQTGFQVALAYPPETLDELGRILREELRLEKTTAEARTLTDNHQEHDSVADESFPIREVSPDEDLPPRQFPKPESCRIAVGEHQGMMTYEIPSPGLFRGSHGLMLFAILWNGFLVVFTSLVAVNGPKDSSLIGFIAFLSLFWAVGIGMAVFAIALGTRKTIVGIAPDRLFVQTKSALGEKWKEALIDDIDSIRIGPSGIEVNDVPVMEIQIRQTSSQKLGLGASLSRSDLDWLAGELHHDWQQRKTQ